MGGEAEVGAEWKWMKGWGMREERTRDGGTVSCLDLRFSLGGMYPHSADLSFQLPK